MEERVSASRSEEHTSLLVSDRDLRLFFWNGEVGWGEAKLGEMGEGLIGWGGRSEKKWVLSLFISDYIADFSEKLI